jgi:hypothetical protein
MSLAIAAALSPGPSDAGSGSKPVDVEIDAPEGCASPDAFWSMLRSRTDRVRRAEARESRTTLQIRLTRTHGRVVGELRMVDDRGGTDTRKVDGASCDEVVQALSLTAALALDPSALLGPAPTPAVDTAPPDRPAPPPKPAEPPDKKVPVETTEPGEPTSPPPVPSVEIGVGGMGMTILSGGFSPGVAVTVRKILAGEGAFRPALGLTLSYSRNDVITSPAVAQVAMAAAAASACPLRWSASVLTVEPCVRVLTGWLSASGRQVTHSYSADRLWLSAGAEARATVYLGAGLALALDAGFTAPLFKRRYFATDPTNVVAETPTISALVGIALTYGF